MIPIVKGKEPAALTKAKRAMRNTPPNSMNSLYIIDCIAAYKAIYTYILVYKSI